MTQVTDSALHRRDVLRALGLTSAAAVALVAPATIRGARAYNPGERERRARYQADSADVQAFYRTNGYESLKK